MEVTARRSRDLPWLSIVLVLTLLVRLAPAPYVVLGDRILFFGHDAWYHMRRIAYTLTNFPATLDFDPYINYPEGARAIWTPIFDWSIAALILPFHQLLSPWWVGLLASLVPPLLGVLTVLALHRLAARHFGGRVALLSTAVLCILPAHFWYTQIGFVDHHCAVALVSTLLLAAGMALLDAVSHGRSSPAGAVWLGGLLGTALLIWPGMLLHVAIAEAALLVLLLTRADVDDVVRVAARLILVQLVAFVVVAPFALGSAWGQWSAFSPVVLSNFQPWLFGSAALFGSACFAMWYRWPAIARSPVTRVASATGAGTAIVFVSALAFPSLVQGGADAWAWLSRSDHFQGLVAESQPLFMARGELSLTAAAANLSAFIFAIPLALVAGLLAARRGSHPASLLLLLGWTLVVCLAAIMQRRFANSASVVVALLLAIGLVSLHDRLKGDAIELAPRRLVALLLTSILGVGMLLPASIIYAPFVAHYVRKERGVVLSGDHFNRFAMTETANWIRLNSPDTRGWLDASTRPEYAVLAPWVMGHVIEYVARRPTVTNNFGDDIGSRNFLAAQEYYDADEARASELLGQLGARYVVVPARTGFLASRPSPRSMYRSLFAHDGSTFVPIDAEPSERVAALERHRLIFEFRSNDLDEARRPAFKVFEHVRGARLRGRTSPHAEIQVELDIETTAGRQIRYEASTSARENGRFELRVPYATGEVDADVRTGEAYSFHCASAHGTDASARTIVVVDELDVRRGAVIAVPDPCSSGQRKSR